MLKLIGIILVVIAIFYFIKSILFLNLKSLAISGIILFISFIYCTIALGQTTVVVSETYSGTSVVMLPLENNSDIYVCENFVSYRFKHKTDDILTETPSGGLENAVQKEYIKLIYVEESDPRLNHVVGVSLMCKKVAKNNFWGKSLKALGVHNGDLREKGVLYVYTSEKHIKYNFWY